MHLNPTKFLWIKATQLNPNLANLLASKFIARPDAKAVQISDGKWNVHTKTGKADGERLGWTRADLQAHLAGERTFGHYLLSEESKCKLFAFDIDLEKAGSIPSVAFETEDVEGANLRWLNSFYEESDLRGAWLNRRTPGRDFMKLQFKQIAHMLCKAIIEQLELPCSVAYSGGKGLHVYAFTGPILASEAREGSQIVLDSLGCFQSTRGTNFFKHTHEDIVNGFPNISIETFPKQGALDGKDLGNLMGLPLGRNMKAPKEPKFFVDMTSPLGVLAPVDAEWALTVGNPFTSL